MVELFLSRGALVDAKGGECKTALHSAEFRGNLDVAKLLSQRLRSYALQKHILSQN